MAPDLEDFCTRFAAGAGSQWAWYLRTDTGALRTVLGDATHCPLTAQYHYETGLTLSLTARRLFFNLVGYSEGVRFPVMEAADNAHGETYQALRARLLRICGLHEEGAADVSS
jgi:hypothetical protein